MIKVESLKQRFHIQKIWIWFYLPGSSMLAKEALGWTENTFPADWTWKILLKVAVPSQMLFLRKMDSFWKMPQKSEETTRTELWNLHWHLQTILPSQLWHHHPQVLLSPSVPEHKRLVNIRILFNRMVPRRRLKLMATSEKYAKEFEPSQMALFFSAQLEVFVCVSLEK